MAHVENIFPIERERMSVSMKVVLENRKKNIESTGNIIIVIILIVIIVIVIICSMLSNITNIV